MYRHQQARFHSIHTFKFDEFFLDLEARETNTGFDAERVLCQKRLRAIPVAIYGNIGTACFLGPCRKQPTFDPFATTGWFAYDVAAGCVCRIFPFVHLTRATHGPSIKSVAYGICKSLSRSMWHGHVEYSLGDDRCRMGLSDVFLSIISH